VADNQAMGLRSPIVLDNAGMSVGKQFGATGTPMAVLIDAAGKIASELQQARLRCWHWLVRSRHKSDTARRGFASTVLPASKLNLFS
jgi:hypothetical protein